MTTDKKKWVVRSWTDDGEGLEKLLNGLYEEGYAVYRLSLSKQHLVAFYKGEITKPSGLGLSDLLSSILAPPKPPSSGQGPVDPDSLEPKGAFTKDLTYSLTSVMDARSNGATGIDGHVESIVKRHLKNVPRHEITLTLEDIVYYSKAHEEYVFAKEGKPCSDACSVSAVLKIAETKIKELIEATPVQ